MKKIGCIPVVLFIMFIFTGVGALCAGRIFNSIWEAEKNRCTDTTTGVVLELVEEVDYDDEGGQTYTYRALTKYSVNNIEYSSENREGYGKNSNPYSVGDTVTVHYNPDKPSEMYLNDGELSSKITTVFTIVGCIFIGVALLILILSVCISRKAYKTDLNNNLPY